MPKEIPALEQRVVAFARSVVNTHGLARQAAQIGALKRTLVAMFAVWIAYFFLIQLFVRKLSQITVPLIETPLSVFLVAQGVAFVFLTSVWLLGRRAAIGRDR